MVITKQNCGWAPAAPPRPPVLVPRRRRSSTRKDLFPLCPCERLSCLFRPPSSSSGWMQLFSHIQKNTLTLSETFVNINEGINSIIAGCRALRKKGSHNMVDCTRYLPTKSGSGGNEKSLQHFRHEVVAIMPHKKSSGEE